ncbi:hypothetical protein C2G38_2033595 [Gigaspora rosea]|uniref:CCHC-type domain-containing protein n=1 Tax=Gigaspora rosea TaxID=44941 RepID=A0A397VKS8_9GLOM|nr:hypothetical protein C2G38_2033595 [Gigaspora rosea]
MAGKYTNIPAQHAGNNIDIPAHFVVWLHHKYQTETFGTQQGVADGDANILGLLKGHLSGELYTWMKIANPAGINAFFTELKNMWLECPLNLYRGSISDQISQAPPITSQSTITSKEMTKPKTDTQVQSQQSISRPVSLQIRPQPAGTSEKILEKNMNKLLLWLYGETPEFVPVQAPSLPPKPQIQKNITSNTNDVDEITKGMADMSLNIVKMAKSVNAVAKTVKKSHRYCSNCGRIGHNSRSCSRKKNKKKYKKKGKINNARIDSDSDTFTNESESNSNSSSESSLSESESEAEINVNISRAKKK